jgi:predicted house-cleaning noncanonical NTP pyrophosphatase (MazG superfamily)
LIKKLGEEYGEFAESRDPGELLDLLDVLRALIHLLDPECTHQKAHEAKTELMGGFWTYLEWNPEP